MIGARGCMARVLVGLLLAASAGLASAQPSATLRGRDGRTVTVESADAAGLVGRFADTRLLVTWDRVRSFEGDQSEQVRAFLEAGELLWRGTSRLDRGDPIAALGAIESAYATFGDEQGATAALAADALLATHLELANAERSVVPWLHVLEHELSLVEAPPARRSPIDADTQLVPGLPPVFLPSRMTPRIAADVAEDGFNRWTEGPNRRLAEIYASALLIAAGESPPPLQGEAVTDGVRLASAMVEARSADVRRRAAARVELQAFLDADDRPWVRAWAHAGIGLSLLLESESERLAGVGHLLVVPSVHGESQAYLAGICLASAAEALADEGRLDAAARLIDTLERQSPSHPALALPSLRGIRSLTASASTNGIGS